MRERIFYESESAFKKKFLDRPVAQLLHKELERGDALIIYKMDRAFRRDQYYADCKRHEKNIEAKTDEIVKLKDDIRILSVDLARTAQSHRSLRFTLGLAAVAGLIGGSIISQFASSIGHPNLYLLGWGIVGTAVAFQLVRTWKDA